MASNEQIRAALENLAAAMGVEIFEQSLEQLGFRRQQQEPMQVDQLPTDFDPCIPPPLPPSELPPDFDPSVPPPAIQQTFQNSEVSDYLVECRVGDEIVTFNV